MRNINLQKSYNDFINFTQERPKCFLFILFCLSVFVKLFAILPFDGPIVMLDEYLYVLNAFALKDFSYVTPHYPPLYSIFLLPATFFKEDFYIVMKLLNILVSSAIIYPVWYICKRIFHLKSCFVLLAVSLLNPYQGSSSELIMSEVLFYPLYILSLYTFVKTLETHDWKYYTSLAVLLSACLLTRYISMMLIPSLGFVFLFELRHNRFNLLKSKAILLKFSAFIALILIICGSFYIPYLDQFLKTSIKYTQIPEKSIISVSTQNMQSSIVEMFFSPPRIIAWFILYNSYFILLVAPLLFIIIKNTFIVFRNIESNRTLYYYILASLSTSFFFILLATKHSSTSDYKNWYILGRYIMFSLPVAFIAFINPIGDISVRRATQIIWITILIYFISVLVIYGRFFGTAGYLMVPHVSPDGYYFQEYWYLVVPLSIIALILSVKESLYFRPIVFIYCLFSFILSIGMNDNSTLKEAKIISKNIAQNGNQTLFLDHSYFYGDSIYVKHFKSGEIPGYLGFWGNKKHYTVANFGGEINEYSPGLVLTSRIIPYEARLDSVLIKDQLMYLYKHPFMNKSKRIDLFNIIDTNENKITVSTQNYSNEASYERNGILHKFLIERGLVNNSMMRNPFVFFTQSKSILKYEHEIIMKPGAEFNFSFSSDSTKNYKLYCQYAILNLIKKMNISDGMHFSIFYQDKLNGKICIFGDFFKPSLVDNTTYICLPNKRNTEFMLVLKTHLNGLSEEGDIMCVKSFDLVE